MIIVIGCDNTGKTSLVNHISKEFNIPISPRFHSLPPKGKQWLEWYEFIKENFQENEQVVFDRFFIDEFIYGPLFRGGYTIGIDRMAELTNLMLTAQPLVIYTHVSVEQNKKSFDDREQYIEKSDIDKVMSEYIFKLKSWPLNQLYNLVRFNYTADSDYSRIDCVIRNYLNGGRI